MTYFNDYLKVIDTSELNKVTRTLDHLYPNTLIMPSKERVFRAFKLCNYHDLKVVMIGQDPYPQKDVATGILFGNSVTTQESNLSPSLKVIKEAVIDYTIPHGIIKFDNTLESWATQGILMLNSALTVEMGKPNSHTMLWRKFISSFLEKLSFCTPGLVYVLFGKQAQTFRPYISTNSTIFEVPHPAYYARMNERFNTTLFKDINTILKERNNFKINYYEEVF